MAQYSLILPTTILIITKPLMNISVSKKQLFDQLSGKAFALSNADDKRGAVMLQNTKAQQYTYSLRVPASIKGKVLEKQS